VRGKNAPKRKKYLGPEADFYDQLKKQLVRVDFISEPETFLVGRLEWVDRFTIGISFENRMIMYYKHNIFSIQLSPRS
jgi:sRNA-binding regulator protein Hfq